MVMNKITKIWNYLQLWKLCNRDLGWNVLFLWHFKNETCIHTDIIKPTSKPSNNFIIIVFHSFCIKKINLTISAPTPRILLVINPSIVSFTGILRYVVLGFCYSYKTWISYFKCKYMYHEEGGSGSEDTSRCFESTGTWR